jgi:tetratricopeptide (TPR) repeat protein
MVAPLQLGILRRLIASLLVCLPAAACLPPQSGGGGVQLSAQPASEAPVTLDRAEAGAHRQLGLGLESAGDIAGAVDEFETALALGPWPIAPSTGGIEQSPYGDLARICARRDTAAQVVRACTRSIMSASLERQRLAELLANRGDAYLRLGDHDRALSDYQNVLKVETNDPRGLFGRGWMRARAGDHTAAISDFNRAINAAPNLMEARLARGHSLAALEDFEAAIADYDHFLGDPEALAAYPDAYRDRARVHCQMGEADAAAIGWQVWLAATPDGAGYVQDMLRTRGYLAGPTGPEFDPTTLAALRAWTRAGCPEG